MQKGYFFTVEGCEGAGKTSVITLASEYLASKGYEIVTSREPGGIEIAEQIRSVILDKKNTLMDGRTEALLYAAARRQHLVEKIVPSLLAGKIVICDRFIDSSLAYQGYARGLGIQEVLAINNFAIDNVLPDLTLYLDVDPQVGLKRIHAHEDREINRLDLESLAFHQQVREGYLEVEKLFPNRIVKVDANHHIEEVFERVKQALKLFLKI
ncbi:dTMP kinase [Paenibacillus radicis (ex Xue et al. 2023)]|uniref:Thymidylate kinase n=1 Tax=Paenibacillus radicis (ex Xue et al. 2023) TaxID=2972489 RepID=A0ABT1YSC0_9BACL|nr:dTMP kinase [Paenibacillus radicis (ex Xue et al. 2023)]MCR8636083.1 dTMP kinase [Paenibacillus radicis (ex Xue et al. 2023)]